MIIIPGKKKNLAKRFYANLIDYFIILILTALYVFAFGVEDENGTYRVTGFKALLIPFVWFVYFPVCESLFGQTIGKKAFHLHIVDLNGNAPTIIQTLFKRFSDPIELASFGISALLTINYSGKNQRLGDMIAGTTVINSDAVCRFCGTEVELSPGEVLRDSFTCPHCRETN
jgi:uncharacterized RDD family membrane protein YckC